MSGILFTSELSRLLRISSSSASSEGRRVRIQIFCGTENIFDNTYYIYGGEISVCGLGRVIERHLLKNGSSYREYRLRMTTQPNGVVKETVYWMVYCPEPMTVTASEFFKTHFLIPPTGGVQDPLADDTYLELPEGFNWPLTVTSWLAKGDDFVVTTYSPSEMNYHRETQEEPVSDGWGGVDLYPLAAVNCSPMYIYVSCGERNAHFQFLPIGKDFMVSPFEPYNRTTAGSLLLRFRNLFNQYDYLWLRGEISTTPAASFQSVRVGGELRKVDVRNDPEYMFTVKRLSMGQALRAARLLTATDVQILRTVDPVKDGELVTDIVITEVNGPVSDNRTELCEVKIKFKLALGF